MRFLSESTYFKITRPSDVTYFDYGRTKFKLKAKINIFIGTCCGVKKKFQKPLILVFEVIVQPPKHTFENGIFFTFFLIVISRKNISKGKRITQLVYIWSCLFLLKVFINLQSIRYKKNHLKIGLNTSGAHYFLQNGYW